MLEQPLAEVKSPIRARLLRPVELSVKFSHSMKQVFLFVDLQLYPRQFSSRIACG